MITISRLQKNDSRSDVRNLTIRGTPGEFKSVKLQVTSTEDLALLTVSLRGANSAQLFMVKRWTQAGVGIYQSEPIEVEELLVKDDRVEYRDGYRAVRKHWKHAFNPLHIYDAPDAPAHSELRTTLQKNHTKSFVIQTQITNVASSNENFQIEFCANEELLYTLDVSVEALPFSLSEPPQDLFIWFKGKLDWRDPQHFLPEHQYRAQLRDIREHGFTSVSINEVDTELAQRAISTAEDVGFSRHILFVPPLPELSKLKFRKTIPIVYASDELDLHTESATPEHAKTLIGFHQTITKRAWEQKTPTMSSLVNGAFIKRFQNASDIGHCPNMVSLYLNKNKEYLQLVSQNPETAKLQMFYYWQCFMEKPNLNRVLAGLYLWKSGAVGISPYCYQHMPKYPNSPYNDFDEWEPDFHEGEIRRPFKDHMTTYPAKNAVIPTLQWEGLRDGITDLKYLHTLHQKLEEATVSESSAKRDLASEIHARTHRFLARINLSKIDINSETQIEPYGDIDAAEYDEFRNQMIDDLLLLTDNHSN